jgi:hypothetical protein
MSLQDSVTYHSGYVTSHFYINLQQKFALSRYYNEMLDTEIIRKYVQQNENLYRGMFVKERTSKALQNPHLMLINVFEHAEEFVYSEGSEEEV